MGFTGIEIRRNDIMSQKKLLMYLVTAKVEGESILIKDALLKFNSQSENNLTIISVESEDNNIKINIKFNVIGHYDEYINVFKNLIEFLTEEKQISDFGFIGITTIPSTYEVVG